jgi:hypothetical protein
MVAMLSEAYAWSREKPTPGRCVRSTESIIRANSGSTRSHKSIRGSSFNEASNDETTQDEVTGL